LSSKLSRIVREYYGDTDRLLADIKMRRTVKIRRTGNSRAVTIPKKWLQELGWKEDDYVQIRLEKSRGIVTLQKPKFQEDPPRTG
jgi:bifunctional DNA-binding transcriptional regulator/antitoxin component of YhaV-PrlF toxin-antitoxin module